MKSMKTEEQKQIEQVMLEQSMCRIIDAYAISEFMVDNGKSNAHALRQIERHETIVDTILFGGFNK